MDIPSWDMLIPGDPWSLIVVVSLTIIVEQETMESFAFPDKIDSIGTEIQHKCSKLYSRVWI